jgi:CRP/FNR family transcriptional regulator
MGAYLFTAGESARGVFMLRRGRVKLTMDSADGKTLILKVAEPGDFLDLGACVLGRPHEVTAEVLEESAVQFVPQPDFMRLIQENPQLCLQVALLLGHDFHEACVELTMLGLSHSAESKLAGLLLRRMREAGDRTALQLNSTHEELAQLIGASRETVTRALARLRRARVIEIQGSKLVVHDPAALRRIENMEHSSAEIGKAPLASAPRPMQAAYAAY